MKKYKQIIPLVIILGIVGITFITKQCKNQPQASTQVVPSNGEYIAVSNAGNPDIHVALGTPTDNTPDDEHLLKRAQYVLSYNPDKHNPNWVSWNLSAYWYGDAERHKGQFMPDPELPRSIYHVTHRDYTGSGFDRGHMVRSEERTRNDEDNTSTFYTTNLLPQYHELNAGPWLKLEDFCQYLCKRKSKELYVIAGPIYSQDLGTIGNDVVVPSECFKIVVILEKGQGLKDINQNTRIIAVRMPNRTDIANEQWRTYETTVRDIEKATGYNFLSNVSKELQDILENRKSSDENM
ncbi:MAG: DNA/RNA non-specific endonuclease [Candidatus Kapabacteria bacterium]|nr:DNA/RNA non-specific endonuclease [Candidatus Kapabacteria bacterium]